MLSTLCRLKAFTTPLQALTGASGIPEVPISGLPSPLSSPPLVALTSANGLALPPKINDRRSDKGGRKKGRREGAAYTIREECERLFCETMKSVFLGERETDFSSVGNVDAYNCLGNQNACLVNSWLELWDYAGGSTFRGFVANSGNERCLFAFFSPSVAGRDLKQGLMALIELSASPLQCSQVVICLTQATELEERQSLMKSLRWVGFELITLDVWAKQRTATSNKWFFLGMEI